MPGIWTNDEEAQFAARMTRLGIMFNREVSNSLLEIYLENLEDLDGDMVVVGLLACEKESRFFPSVSEIRERSGYGNVAMMHERIANRVGGPAPKLDGPDQSARIVADVVAEAKRRANGEPA